MKVVPEDVSTAPLAVLFRGPQSTANKTYIIMYSYKCAFKQFKLKHSQSQVGAVRLLAPLA